MRIIIGIQLIKADKELIIETLRSFITRFDQDQKWEKVQLNIILFSDVVHLLTLEDNEFKFQVIDE